MIILQLALAFIFGWLIGLHSRERLVSVLEGLVSSYVRESEKWTHERRLLLNRAIGKDASEILTLDSVENKPEPEEPKRKIPSMFRNGV